MKLKKGWKRFWTLNRHHADGFTLVELIVVIAILAILAGVGSVGYSGYIKSARKKADQTLVANIIRAVETGVASTTFTPPASLSISATTYPVGFISLSTNGGEILTSNSIYTDNVEGECEFVTLTNATVVNCVAVNKIYTCDTWRCGETETIEKVYSVSDKKDIVVCTKHSDYFEIIEDAPETTYVTDYVFDCKYDWGKIKHNGGNKITETVSGNIILADVGASVYYEQTNGLCELAYANQTGSFVAKDDSGDRTTVDGDHALNQAINAAFGATDLKLQYDGWGEESKTSGSYATYYETMPELMTDVKTLGDKLLPFANEYTYSAIGLSGTYSSTDQIVNNVANTLVKQYTTADDWVDVWMKINDSSVNTQGVDYSFGLPGYRDIYCAARLAYNKGFVSYLVANNASDTCINAVNEYGEHIPGYNVTLPKVVCDKAFVEHGEVDFVDSLGADSDAYKELKKFYDDYKNSETCRQNGIMFYQTMSTIDDTYEEATNEDNAIGGGDFFKYYDHYLQELSGIYSEAEEKSKNGILIIVNMNNDKLEFLVSPSSADLRNE